MSPKSNAVQMRLELLKLALECAELEVQADEAWERMLVEEFGEEEAAQIVALVSEFDGDAPNTMQSAFHDWAKAVKANRQDPAYEYLPIPGQSSFLFELRGATSTKNTKKGLRRLGELWINGNRCPFLVDVNVRPAKFYVRVSSHVGAKVTLADTVYALKESVRKDLWEIDKFHEDRLAEVLKKHTTAAQSARLE